MLTMLGAIAELEREIIREQMSENKVARWRRHEIFVGKPPFGYVWNKEKKCLEINLSEADIYKRIVSMYLDEGLSFRDIGIKLRNEGIKCKRAYFTNSTISYMLKNPAYYGHYILNQWKYKDNKRQNECKSGKEYISFPIPELIDKLTWDRIQDKTLFNKVKSKRITAARDYWLRDILQCRECGSAIKPHHGSYRKDGTFPRYYSCYWASTSKKNLISARKDRCVLPTIKADALEALIWDIIVGKLSFHRRKEFDKSSGKLISKNREYISEIIGPEQFDAKIKELEDVDKKLSRELNGKELAKKKLYSMLEDDVPFSKEDFYLKLKEYDDTIITLKANISNNKQQLLLSKKAKDDAYSLREFMHKNDELLDNIMKELDNCGRGDKKLLAESLVEGKIEVFKKGESECLRLVSWKGEPIDWCLVPFRLVFNPNVFQRLISEGKIPSIKSKWSLRSCRP